MQSDDVAELVSAVTLRILRKVMAAAVFEEESVQNLDAYVTTLTKNAARDFMRRRWPERARLKQRVRYVFLKAPSLTLSVVDGTTVCSLTAWEGRLQPVADGAVLTGALSGVSGNISADEIEAALIRIGQPVRMTDLVGALIKSDSRDVVQREESEVSYPFDTVEARQYLEVLWEEIRELPTGQRAALLLNLREPVGGNAAALLVLLGIATIEKIATMVGMSTAQLASIWDDLPLDDLQIAEHLGLQRQQVINMRKSARERLARRMRRRSDGK